MLIRSMAPRVIAVDEIGSQEDIFALEYAIHCGCKMIATMHGSSMEEVRNKPIFERLVRERQFDRYVVLKREPCPGTVAGIYDEEFRPLFRS